MIKYKNLFLIGTSHISKDSVKEVGKVITKIKPGFVALELDKERFNFLVNKNNLVRRVSLSNIRKLGLKVFLLNLVGAWFEKRLGKQVDMTTMTPAKWREMTKSGNKFVVSVSKSNILLWGSEL